MEPFDIGQGDDLCQADRHVADDEESKLLTHELCNTLHPIEVTIVQLRNVTISCSRR